MMKFTFTNPAAVDVQSGEAARDVLNDGRYHVECVSFQEKEDGENPHVRLNLEVRDGTDKSQRNKVHTQFLNYTVHSSDYVQKKNEAHMALFARILGAAPADMEAKARAGEDVQFDWSKTVGKHCVIEIETRQNKDKTKTYKGEVAESCIYAVDDPKVADVPKDATAITRSQAADVF